MKNDFHKPGITISAKTELRFPQTGQVMDFTPEYSKSKWEIHGFC